MQKTVPAVSVKDALRMMVDELEKKGLLQGLDKETIVESITNTMMKNSGKDMNVKNIPRHMLKDPKMQLALTHIVFTETCKLLTNRLINKFDPMGKGLDKLTDQQKLEFQKELKEEIKGVLKVLNNKLPVPLKDEELDQIATKIMNNMVSQQAPQVLQPSAPGLNNNSQNNQSPDQDPQNQIQNQNQNQKTPTLTPNQNQVSFIFVTDDEGNVLGVEGVSVGGNRSDSIDAIEERGESTELDLLENEGLVNMIRPSQGSQYADEDIDSLEETGTLSVYRSPFDTPTFNR